MDAYRSVGRRVGDHAGQGSKPALIEGGTTVCWRDFVPLTDRIAQALIGLGVGIGDKVAVLAPNSIAYAAIYIGALRAGACVVPLSTMAAGAQLAAMIEDCDAKALFVAADDLPLIEAHLAGLGKLVPGGLVALDFERAGFVAYRDFLARGRGGDPGIEPPEDSDCNMIYSSGTTGAPKGIVHSQAMRSGHVERQRAAGYDNDSVTLCSTPLYSNTTLVSFLPTLALGGTVVLMRRFDVAGFLELCQRHRVTNAMLVPVQYKRILAHPDFGRFDLSAFRLKQSTSAPLSAALKRDILDRWPGRMVESYGLTEGGCVFSLDCGLYPDKLHTVGKPTPDSEALTIDAAGRILPPGEVGEIVGRGSNTMSGYYKQPGKTRAMDWTHPDGRVFMRTGDMGRMDADGFLTLLDRGKDMIISGGFNVYPADIELLLAGHPEVDESAVIGVPSEAWGETPLALVVRKPGAGIGAEALRDWVNAKLGKAQRLSAVEFRESLPRSTIGKVLKRELRAPYWAGQERAIG